MTLAWLGIEGAVGIIAGIVAGSIALIGFGIDSAIKAIASIIIVWRFTGERTLSETAEHRAQKLVAASFFLLALRRHRGYPQPPRRRSPDTSYVGIALSVGAILTMILLEVAKSASASSSTRAPPRVRALRICYAHTSPPPY